MTKLCACNNLKSKFSIEDNILVAPHTKACVCYQVDTTGGVYEQKILINVNGKDFIGYIDDIIDPGGKKVWKEVVGVDEECQLEKYTGEGSPPADSNIELVHQSHNLLTTYMPSFHST